MTDIGTIRAIRFSSAVLGWIASFSFAAFILLYRGAWFLDSLARSQVLDPIQTQGFVSSSLFALAWILGLVNERRVLLLLHFTCLAIAWIYTLIHAEGQFYSESVACAVISFAIWVNCLLKIFLIRQLRRK